MKRTQKTMIQLLKKQAEMYKIFMMFYKNVHNVESQIQYTAKYYTIKDVIDMMEDDAYFSYTWDLLEDESEVEQ